MNTIQCEVCKHKTMPKADSGLWMRWECSRVECPHRRSAWSDREMPDVPPQEEGQNLFERIIEGSK